MTRDQAKEKFATALRIVTANRTGGLPPFSGLAPDIESWPLTRIGGEQPLSIFEWFEVYQVCLRGATDAVDFHDHDHGSDTTVGDFLDAIREAHPVPEHRPEVRGV